MSRFSQSRLRFHNHVQSELKAFGVTTLTMTKEQAMASTARFVPAFEFRVKAVASAPACNVWMEENIVGGFEWYMVHGLDDVDTFFAFEDEVDSIMFIVWQGRR